jgi:lipopolysaccharide export system protein LptC
MKDRWLAYVPMLLLAGLALLSYWLDQRVQPGNRVRGGDPGSAPDYIVEHFTATRMNPDGTPRYAVAARRMLHYPGDNSALLEHPELSHFDPKRAPVTIRADEGRLLGNSDEAVFSGNVQVRRHAFADNPEMTLSTSRLQVLPNRDLARTDREVRLTSGNSTLTSVGLEFNNATRTLKLLSKVSGSFDTPKKGVPLPWDKRRQP